MEATVSTARPFQMDLRSNRCRLTAGKSKPSSTTPSECTELSSSVNGETVNEEDDDGDDESDRPAVYAPSYRKSKPPSRKTGLHKMNLRIETTVASKAKEVLVGSEHHEASFSPTTQPFDVASSEDDDDEIYQAVDDISDDEDIVEFQDEQILLDEFSHEPISFLDRLSDIGNDEDFALGAVFDDFSSGSSAGSSTAGSTKDNTESGVRRVSFKEDDQRQTSPVTALTTLKASASTSSKASSEKSPLHPSTFHDEDSDYDSMLKIRFGNRMLISVGEMTDENLPSEVHGTPDVLHIPPVQRSNSNNSTKPLSARKGPRCGWFDIDPNQTWSILHPSGKKMLIMPRTDTGRHDWLEDKLRSTSVLTSASSAPPSTPISDRSQPAAASAPDTGIEGEMVTGTVNPIMAALTRVEGPNDTHGHATGPPEAFAPLPLYQDAADFQLDSDGDGGEFVNDDDDPEEDLLMDNFIKYDDVESSDEEGVGSRPSTAMPPPKTPTYFHNRSNSAFAHLNNLNSENIMAFRRNIEELQTSPTSFLEASALTPGHGLMRDAFHTPKTALPASTRGHKRKASNEPYSSAHYDGVTPVERKILNTSHQLLKRRKITM